MFYTGVAAGRSSRSVGLATSTDGVSWTKHPNNPIFTGSGEVENVVNPVVLLDGETWIMYYNRPVNEVGTQIWRATAPAPEGPWSPDEAPVFSSEPPTWDIRKLPIGIFMTEDGYQLFYLGWGSLPTSRMQVGLATSADGITFAAYDDPATTDGIYAKSDPVLPAGDEGDWDALSVSPSQIWRGEDGYELFYMGAQQNLDVEEDLEGAAAMVGYATSSDGLTWTKYQDNPVLDLEVSFWASVSTARIGDLYHIYYEDQASEIALLTGTITQR
jgi:hypothetical protein